MQNTLEPRPEGKDTHRGSGDCWHWIREAPWYLNWLDRFSTLFCWREVHFMPLPVQPAQTDPAGSWVGRVSSWRHRPRIRQVRWRQKIGAPLLCLQLLGSFHWRGYSWPWPGRVNPQDLQFKTTKNFEKDRDNDSERSWMISSLEGLR